MAGEIIAERFALLKTRGGNGLAFTHLVEDTLYGRRAVVKVSDRLGLAGLEYLKAVNMLAESGVEGLLLPLEGGLLEEEGGYYLAFPEVVEPSLEDYLRMRPRLGIREILEIMDRVLAVLDGMHRAGFLHLFLEPRNVFYLPRRSVTLKDPALRADFFHPFLELLCAPDFSYLHPSLMDGGMPGRGADIYAAGRLGERLREEVGECGEPGPALEALKRFICACRDVDVAGERVSAEGLRALLREALAVLPERQPGSPPSAGNSPVAWKVEGVEPAWDAESPRGVGGTAPEGVTLEAWLEFNPGKETGLPGPDRPRRRRGRAGGRWKGICAVALFALWLFLGIWLALPSRTARGRGNPASMAGAGAGRSEAGAVEAAAQPASAEGAEVFREVLRAEVTDAVEADPAAETSSANGETAGGPYFSRRSDPAGGGMTPSPATSVSGGERSPTPPVASFNMSPAQGESPLQVLLDASGSYDPDGEIVSYTWSFGGSGRVLYHIFESNVIPASVTVTLTVTDDGGHMATCSRRLVLY